MVPRVSGPRRSRLVFVGLWFCSAVVLPAAGCTLLVDASPTQCRQDQDCARFAGTTCDRTRGVCTAAPGNNGDAANNDPHDAEAPPGQLGALLCPTDAGVGADSGPGLELLNACTDAVCVPFDNRARLLNLASDGSLKPLPDSAGASQ
jgi:hypothetical protein